MAADTLEPRLNDGERPQAVNEFSERESNEIFHINW